MKKVKCNGCGKNMDCPESMIKANKHFCDRCTDMLEFGFKEEELKEASEHLVEEKLFKRCDEVADELLDLTFWGFWDRTKKIGLDKFTEEQLAKEFYLHGASSTLGLLLSMGIDPEILDEIEFVAKKTKKTSEHKKMVKKFKEK